MTRTSLAHELQYAIELARGSLTSENPRFKVVAHAALYLPLFFGLIAAPIAALYFLHEMGWDKVAPSYDPGRGSCWSAMGHC